MASDEVKDETGDKNEPLSEIEKILGRGALKRMNLTAAEIIAVINETKKTEEERRLEERKLAIEERKLAIEERKTEEERKQERNLEEKRLEDRKEARNLEERKIAIEERKTDEERKKERDIKFMALSLKKPQKKKSSFRAVLPSLMIFSVSILLTYYFDFPVDPTYWKSHLERFVTAACVSFSQALILYILDRIWSTKDEIGEEDGEEKDGDGEDGDGDHEKGYPRSNIIPHNS